MRTQFFGGRGPEFAIIRYALVTLGVSAVILSLGDSVSGQSQAALRIAAAKAAPPKPWPPARLPDGQPDVQGGHWTPETNAFFGGTQSLENPSRVNVRFQEPDAPPRKQPSRIVDPADGRIPYLPWAAERKKQQEYDLEHPTRIEHLDTQHRCLTAIPRLHYYVASYRILQIPGSVVFVYGGDHQYRVVPVDGSPHIGSTAKLWMGDPRGHWEETTLVVDTTNHNGKGRLSNSGDFFSDNAHLVERFRFLNADTINYEVTIDDPKVFSRPWTMRVVQKRTEEDEMWEGACHEGERIDQDDRILQRGEYAKEKQK